MKKIMCFTHWDLDGATCYQLLRWTFPKCKVEYVATTVQNFRNAYTKWLSKNNIEDYEKIFITDLDVSDNLDLIDKDNFFIIDHHGSHSKAEYKHAKNVVKDFTSASKLAYMIFKKLYNIELSKPKKKLILIVDDFDSYKHEFAQSAKLNVVFWDTNDKFNAFTKNFGNGFNGFSPQQESMIKIHDTKLKDIEKKLEVYAGTAHIQDKDRYVCAAFGSQYINEMADILLNNHNADIAIIVNVKTNHISFRKGKTQEDLDLSELAKKLSDGAGHEYASGGMITENFELFTKKLSKIN